MDSLKTVVDKAFDQIFKETQKSKLKVNEVEFALRNFSQIAQDRPEGKDQPEGKDRPEGKTKTKGTDKEPEAAAIGSETDKEQKKKIRELRPRQERKEYGIILFDRLA